MIHVARVYGGDLPKKGKRYLVDRLWPRGVRKGELALDGWLKDVAPSDALRKSFAHDPAHWSEFRRRYFAELEKNPSAWRGLLDEARKGDIVLLFGKREPLHNNAVALQEFLESRLGGRGAAKKQGNRS